MGSFKYLASGLMLSLEVPILKDPTAGDVLMVDLYPRTKANAGKLVVTMGELVLEDETTRREISLFRPSYAPWQLRFLPGQHKDIPTPEDIMYGSPSAFNQAVDVLTLSSINDRYWTIETPGITIEDSYGFMRFLSLISIGADIKQRSPQEEQTKL